MGFLLASDVVKAEHEERVGIRENPLIDQLFETCLVNALEHGNGMTGDLARQLLEGEGGAVEELQGARDALEEVHCVPFRSLISRPCDPPDLGHG